MSALYAHKIDMAVKRLKCAPFIFAYIQVEHKSYIVDESKRQFFSFLQYFAYHVLLPRSFKHIETYLNIIRRFLLQYSRALLHINPGGQKQLQTSLDAF